jgi:hypothetical protein
VKELMGVKLVNDISTVLSLSQNFIQSSYSYKETTPMGDSSRNKFFGNKFAKSVSPSCTSNFEYLDIFVSSGARLNRHMD